MCKKPVGVFDSGLGGLTAVKELMRLLPNENIVYFGDTGRVPYGTRSRETIKKYAVQDTQFLLSRGVKMIIAACGTASSCAEGLKEQLDVPYTGVVAPTAYAACSATRNGRIGVIGTTATVNSGSYSGEIARIDKNIQVFQQDCPLFVPLVENGFIDGDDPIVQMVVERYLKPLKEKDIDTLILGCTHYPLLKEAIERYTESGVKLVDSGRETAVYAAKLLERNGLLNPSNEKGAAEFFVSDTPDGFSGAASLFLGENMEHNVSQIDIEQY